MSKEKMVMKVRVYPNKNKESNYLGNATVNIGTKDASLIAINDVTLREVKKDDKTYTFVDLPKRQLKDREGNPLKDENGHNQYAEYVSFKVDDEKHPGLGDKIRNLISNEVRKAYENCKDGQEYGESKRETDFVIDPDRVSAYTRTEKSPASVYIGNVMRIDNVYVNEKDGQKHISMPYEKYEQEGESKYRSLVSPVQKGLASKILDAVEKARTRVPAQKEVSEEQEQDALDGANLEGDER